MTKNKILIGIASVMALLLLSVSYTHSTFNCPKLQPSSCGLMENAVLVVGALSVFKTSLKDSFTPGRAILVEDENGNERQGILTGKAISGRNMDVVTKAKIDCSAAQPFEDGRLCELKFVGFDPFSSCLKGSPCYGEVPGWGIKLSADGSPDENLLKYKK